MSFSGWYAFDDAQQTGVSFGGNQAIAFGYDHNGAQVFVNLADEGVRWAAFRPDGQGGNKFVGSVKIIANGDGSLEFDSALANEHFGDPGFSPPPPKLFNGRATKVVFPE